MRSQKVLFVEATFKGFGTTFQVLCIWYKKDINIQTDKTLAPAQHLTKGTPLFCQCNWPSVGPAPPPAREQAQKLVEENMAVKPGTNIPILQLLNTSTCKHDKLLLFCSNLFWKQIPFLTSTIARTCYIAFTSFFHNCKHFIDSLLPIVHSLKTYNQSREVQLTTRLLFSYYKLFVVFTEYPSVTLKYIKWYHSQKKNPIPANNIWSSSSFDIQPIWIICSYLLILKTMLTHHLLKEVLLFPD